MPRETQYKRVDNIIAGAMWNEEDRVLVRLDQDDVVRVYNITKFECTIAGDEAKFVSPYELSVGQLDELVRTDWEDKPNPLGSPFSEPIMEEIRDPGYEVLVIALVVALILFGIVFLVK